MNSSIFPADSPGQASLPVELHQCAALLAQRELPAGWEGQVRPRSGLALRHGVSLLNTPGTIDSDYRGEVMVILVNLGRREFRLSRGDRIAQLVVAPVSQVVLVEADKLASTSRGEGGFGSTGVD